MIAFIAIRQHCTMDELKTVDDVRSFERVAQMRRMNDVQPAVLSQSEALDPTDLVPVQFQFSRRRTDLIIAANDFEKVRVVNTPTHTETNHIKIAQVNYACERIVT